MKNKLFMILLSSLFLFCPFNTFAQNTTTISEEPALTANAESDTTTENSSVQESNSLSMEELLELANKGNTEAMYDLGYLYSYSEDTEPDYEKTIYWWEKAADEGSSISMYSLGFLYYQGTGVEKDINKTLEWWKKAADNGSSEAMYILGSLYYTGESVEQDYELAFEWWYAASEAGNADALYSLGFLFENGLGTDKNEEMAQKCYEASGYADAKEVVGSNDEKTLDK